MLIVSITKHEQFIVSTEMALRGSSVTTSLPDFQMTRRHSTRFALMVAFESHVTLDKPITFSEH